MSRKRVSFEPRCLLLMLLPSLLLLPDRNPSAFHHARVPLDRCLKGSTARPAPPPTWTPLARRIGPLLKESEGARDATGNDDKAVPGDDGGAGGEGIAPAAPPPAATAGTTAAVVEGEATNPAEGEQQEEGVGAAAAVDDADLGLEARVASFEFAPPMTVRKFKTMQDRRVPVSIKYSGGGGFKRYFEEIAKVLKRHFPDVLIDREIVEVSSTREEEVFEIRIDGKLVCAKRRGKPGVFLHMETFAQAIRKARQRRRPGAIVYGDQETYMNVKALTDQRTAGDSLERDFQDFAIDEDTTSDK
ncbi:unnamed protein product [Ectocarpus sp. CCAP 1310/34]|nr:unnamed protein product [Ectocarpus sp. CCAP 1310/34]